MALVNQVNKRVMFTHFNIVKYQILTYGFINNLSLSEGELNTLTILAVLGQQELTVFCDFLHSKKIFSSSQSARNCITRLEKKNLIEKKGKNKKKIQMSDSIVVVTKKPVLLNFNFLCVDETKKS